MQLQQRAAEVPTGIASQWFSVFFDLLSGNERPGLELVLEAEVVKWQHKACDQRNTAIISIARHALEHYTYTAWYGKESMV